MGHLTSEDDVSLTSKPDESDDEVQVVGVTKLFNNFAVLVCQQHSIDTSRFYEKLRETLVYREIQGIIVDITRRERH